MLCISAAGTPFAFCARLRSQLLVSGVMVKSRLCMSVRGVRGPSDRRIAGSICRYVVRSPDLGSSDRWLHLSSCRPISRSRVRVGGRSPSHWPNNPQADFRWAGGCSSRRPERPQATSRLSRSIWDGPAAGQAAGPEEKSRSIIPCTHFGRQAASGARVQSSTPCQRKQGIRRAMPRAS
jgi:hypothetical protein